MYSPMYRQNSLPPRGDASLDSVPSGGKQPQLNDPPTLQYNLYQLVLYVTLFGHSFGR